MKFLSALIATSLVNGVYSATCNANNCQRLVAGTAIVAKPAKSVRQADCSSFMVVTVTPAATTVTLPETLTQTSSATALQTSIGTETDTFYETDTQTFSDVVTQSSTTTTIVETYIFIKRQATASQTAVPTYAQSVCLSPAAYSSACSCAGITRTMITAATPTVTVTTSNTVQTTQTTTIPTTLSTTVSTTITSLTAVTLSSTVSDIVTSTRTLTVFAR